MLATSVICFLCQTPRQLYAVVRISSPLFSVLTVLQSSRNSAAKDTCEAMDQWAQHPQSETALSNILPCVDESTTNRTLYQS